MLRAEEPQAPHVTVYGTATREVVPNQMVWHMTVRNTNSSAEAAAKEHARSVSALLALLKHEKIEPKAIQTSRMMLGENLVQRNQSMVKDGYYASTDISFTDGDFDNYAALWIGLSSQKHATINSVTFDHTERIRLQNETRTEAVLAAKHKAETMAATVGAAIGDPLLIEEELGTSVGWGDSRSRGFHPSNVVLPAQETGDTRAQLAPGSIPIRIRIKAVFELQHRE